MSQKQVLVSDEAKRQYELLRFQSIEITPEDEFMLMLDDSIKQRQPLRVKCGIDPTGKDVHLGHCVPYKKMRQFQDLGHIGVVIIGDYTAQIGDPTGKNESRPALSADEVKDNAQRYLEQVYKILDPKRTEVRWQSEWFSKVTLADTLKWAYQTTVSKLLSHDTFRVRLDSFGSLGLHELFYPVLQGIDSVYVKSDVELGGSDQKFNVLMGRDYQRYHGLRPQVAMLLPIILGTDGKEKMSKSLGNYVGVLDEPFDQFGKVMSIPDSLMLDWAKYVSTWSEQQYDEFEKNVTSGSLHPNIAKKNLAQNIVKLFYGEATALAMRKQFEKVFAKKDIPDDIASFLICGEMRVIDVMVQAQLCKSSGEGKRLLAQNAVSFVDGEKIQTMDYIIGKQHDGKVLKVGKRKFIKLTGQS